MLFQWNLVEAMGRSDHLPVFVSVIPPTKIKLHQVARKKLHRWVPADLATFQSTVTDAFSLLATPDAGGIVATLGHCARKQQLQARSGLSRPSTDRVRAAQARLREADGVAQQALARRHLRSI
jgi:hypothetical protein